MWQGAAQLGEPLGLHELLHPLHRARHSQGVANAHGPPERRHAGPPHARCPAGRLPATATTSATAAAAAQVTET